MKSGKNIARFLFSVIFSSMRRHQLQVVCITARSNSLVLSVVVLVVIRAVIGVFGCGGGRSQIAVVWVQKVGFIFGLSIKQTL